MAKILLGMTDYRDKLVGLKTSVGLTVLHAACNSGNTELAKMLIEAGAGTYVELPTMSYTQQEVIDLWSGVEGYCSIHHGVAL